MFYKLESVLQSQGQILRSWNVFHFYKNAILRHIVQILFGVFFYKHNFSYISNS